MHASHLHILFRQRSRTPLALQACLGSQRWLAENTSMPLIPFSLRRKR